MAIDSCSASLGWLSAPRENYESKDCMSSPTATVEAPETLDRIAIRREILRLAIPAVGNSLLHVAVFFVDRMLIGQYRAESLAAMQIAGPLTWTLHSILTCFLVGAVALVARATGAKDREGASRAICVTLWLALFAGLVAAALVPFLPAILETYRSETVGDDAIRGAWDYMRAVLPAFPLFCTGLAISSLMGARGNTRTPFLVGIATNLTNVSLNYILIYGRLGAPELGIHGAGLATAASWVVECVILSIVLCRGERRLLDRYSEPFSLAWSEARATLGRMLKIAAPTFSERLVFHAGFLIFAAMITRLGTKAMAANQACIAIESLSFTTSTACGIAAAALVGQRLGARDPQGAVIAAWEAVKLASVFLCSAALIYLLAPELLVSAFSSDPEVIQLGATALLIGVLEQPSLAFADVLSQSLRGAGDTRSPLLVTTLCVWFVRVPGTWLAIEAGWGLSGVWMVTAVDWAVRGAIIAVIFRSGRWQSIEI